MSVMNQLCFSNNLVLISIVLYTGPLAVCFEVVLYITELLRSLSSVTATSIRNGQPQKNLPFRLL